MVRLDVRVHRALAVGFAAVLTLAACGPGTSPSASTGGAESAGPSTGEHAKGGTIFVLTQAEQIDQIDPQRMYTGEDLALFGGTVYRSLEAYKFSEDPTEGTSLTPDLATDLGTPNATGDSWSFTLRDGVTFEDGSEITCEDVKYGTSRTFATGVINQGPTYAIAYLDIPTVEGFAKQGPDDPNPGQPKAASSSVYGGPYSDDLLIYTDESLTTFIANDPAAFDKAVTCDGKTITFNLNKPVADFNYTVTLGFSPVPEAADTGETYGQPGSLAVASGPYKFESYSTGNGGKMVLVRNDAWNQESDDYRGAYPDKWEIDFGIDPKVLDQRLIAASGNDQYAIQYGQVQPENLAVIFADTETPNPDFAGRAVSGFDPYTRYYYIDVNKVPNLKIRQAMAVALDREAIRLNVGGDFAGELADGLVKPNIGADYAPTGFWTDFFGKPIPDNGDPELAKQLIADSGEAAPSLTFNFPDTPTQQNNAAIVISSLGLAGITVTPNPIEAGIYYSVVFDPTNPGDFGYGGWGADWPNASTVIPPLLTVVGGWDLSQLDDPDFNAEVDAASTELDRTKQQTLWQALDKKAIENVYTIPYLFGTTQTLAGTKVGPIYRWPAYGSWPYGEMYVLP
jgi:peptide/nickel transport system substrate-binding protein